MSISVINLNQVPHLSFGLRSSIISHLEGLIKKLDTTELFLNEPNLSQSRFLKVSDIAVEPIVVTEELIPIPSNLSGKEREEMERKLEGDA